jgi:hypothetical protein
MNSRGLFLSVLVMALLAPVACEHGDRSGAGVALPPDGPDWIELVGAGIGAPPPDRLVVTVDGGARFDTTVGAFRQPLRLQITLISPCDGRQVAWLLKVLDAAADQPRPIPRVRKGGPPPIAIRWRSGQKVRSLILDERVLEPGVWQGILDELDYLANADLAHALWERSEAERLAQAGDAKQACEKLNEALRLLWHWDGARVSRSHLNGIFEPQLQLGETQAALAKEDYGEALRLLRDIWGRGLSFESRQEGGATITSPLFGNMGDGPATMTLEPKQIERLKGWRFAYDGGDGK